MAKPPSTVVRMVGKTRAPTGKRLHVAMGNHHAIFMGKLTNCLWSFSIANCLFTRGYLDAWWLSIIHNITCKLRTFWDSQPYTILIISGNVAGYGHLKSPYTLEKYGEIWRCFILLFSYFQVNLIHTPGESIWLVLSPPLKNISQLRWWNVQLNGKIKVMCQSPPTQLVYWGYNLSQYLYVSCSSLIHRHVCTHSASAGPAASQKASGREASVFRTESLK